MPDNQEEVRYEFIGDISSLKKATNDALDLLKQYQQQMDRMTSDGGFGKNVKAAKSFQSQINATTKQVTKLQKQMSNVSDIKLYPSGKLTQQLAKEMDVMKGIAANMWSKPSLTTKEVQGLTRKLKAVKQGLSNLAPEVDKQVQQELKWQNTLDSVSGRVSKFRDTLDGIRQSGANAMNPLLQKFSAMTKYFDTMRTKLQSLKDRGSAALTRASQLASTVASAFRRQSVSGDADAAADSSVNKHSRLFNILTRVQQAFRKEKTAIEDEKKSLETKDKALDSSTQRHSALRNIIVNLGRSFQAEVLNINNFSTGLKGLGNAAKNLKRALVALIGVPISRWLVNAANESISYAENLNLFTVAVGEAYEESYAFVEQMQELYGMDPNNLLRYTGYFYQLADAIDMPSRATANLSLYLTKATNDIASLFNVDIETVAENMASGMQGMSRAVRKYGMDIRAVTLQQTALSLGITEQVETMSEANRMGLRFITMMRQAQNASGDFARTIEQPANQLRIFKEQMSQLGRAIGDTFIGPLTTAVQHINGFVMALRIATTYINSVLGIVEETTSNIDTEGADNAAEALGAIGNAATSTSKKIKNLLAPFDELNILTEQSTDDTPADIGTLDPAIAEEIANMEYKLEEVRMKANEVRDAILDFFGFTTSDGKILSWDASVFEENLINKFPQWTETIQAVFDNWSDIVDGFKSVWQSLGTVIGAIWEEVLSLLSKFVNDQTVSEFVNNLGENLRNLAGWIEKNASTIAKFILALLAMNAVRSVLATVSHLVQSFGALSGITNVVTGALGALTAPMLAVAAAVAVAVIAIVDLLFTNEEFRDKAITAWQSFAEVISTLWSTMIKPVLKSLGSAISSLYTNVIKPVVGTVGSIVLILWNDILQPLLNWIVTSLGPGISNVLSDILSVLEWGFDAFGGIISGVLQTLRGLLDFIAGVFTGDWSRAWQGVVDVFAGIFNAIGSLVVAVMNSVITVINGAISLIYNAIVSLINLITGVVGRAAKIFGFDVDLAITAKTPQIPYIQAPRVAMANGAVVTGPTNALIGEGRYDEMVMPLGNSPQVNEFADSVASRVNSAEQIALLKEQNELLRQILDKTGTSLDGKMVSDIVSRHQRNRARATGGSL